MHACYNTSDDMKNDNINNNGFIQADQFKN